MSKLFVLRLLNTKAEAQSVQFLYVEKNIASKKYFVFCWKNILFMYFVYKSWMPKLCAKRSVFINKKTMYRKNNCTQKKRNAYKSWMPKWSDTLQHCTYKKCLYVEKIMYRKNILSFRHEPSCPTQQLVWPRPY